MFKGKLIENKNYYNLRSKQLLYITLPSIVVGLFVNFFQLPTWITIVAVIFYVVIMIQSFRNQKAMFKVTNKRIEMVQDKIEIKEVNGRLIETIELKNVDKLIVKNDYKMPQETMEDLKEEIKGDTEEHYIILEKNNEQRRLDFVIESFYMLNQPAYPTVDILGNKLALA